MNLFMTIAHRPRRVAPAPAPPAESALSIACAEMSTGWSLYADDGEKGWTDALLSTGTNSIMDYGAHGHHDTAHGEIHWLGQGHIESWKHVRFVEANDAWEVVSTVPDAGFGHNFDMDSMVDNGDIYRRMYDSATFRKWTRSTETWADVTAQPAKDSITCGTAWHPGMQRIVTVAAGQIRLYNPTTNSWADGGTVSGMAAYSSVALYCPGQDVVVFGGGSGSGSTKFWQINAAGTVTALADAPAGYGASTGLGHISYDSVSGRVVLFASGGGTVPFQIYDYTFGAGWSASLGNSPFSAALVQCGTVSLYNYGRIMLLSRNPRQVYLYRHS